MAVCDKTNNHDTNGPNKDQLFFVEPLKPIAPEDAKPFNCRANAIRDPRQTKGEAYDVTTEASSCCGTDGCC
jgi:arsenite methyltransferase